MAKRKTLVAPSSEDLSRLEDEFRRETSGRPPLAAPIAHVAAETAAALDPRPAADRAVEARDRADALRLRSAEEHGLVIREIPLEQIDADALVRDRMVLDADELMELQTSIAAHGLRLPIEVFETVGTGQGTPTYGLLSGYRRLRAVQNLRGLSGQAKYATIKAMVRDPASLGGPFAAMVEENEIRSSLSHFERGRIAVIAAQQGVFPNVEAAVDGLFSQASKAKRSKIRSFALIFEELGDMLSFPDALREKDGLRLAAALREGAEARLRDGLAENAPETPADELDRLMGILDRLEPAPQRPERGGRPTGPRGRSTALASGVRLSSGHDGQHWFIRIEGKRVDAVLVDDLLRELERLLGRA
jgi:ParB family chromosome partitioning protein